MGSLRRLSQLVEDSCLETGGTVNNGELTRGGKTLGRLRARVDTIDNQLTRLIAIFQEEDVVPQSLKDRCLKPDEERISLKAKILRLENQIVELRQSVSNPERVGTILKEFSEIIQYLPLAAQKEFIGEHVKRVLVNTSTPKSGTRNGQGRSITRTLVNIQMLKPSCKVAKSVAMTGFAGDSGKRVNQISTRRGVGTPTGSRTPVTELRTRRPRPLDDGGI